MAHDPKKKGRMVIKKKKPVNKTREKGKDKA